MDQVPDWRCGLVEVAEVIVPPNLAPPGLPLRMLKLDKRRTLY